MGGVLANDRLSVARALAVTLLLSLALAACGRKGPLDPPPSAALPPQAPAAAGPAPARYIDPTTPTGGPQSAPVQTTQVAPAPPPQKKSFILDPLIQ
ncbi:MAG: LPS translocon maturation chaperone LptM [Xanthobacteraceae bacterium]